MKKYLNGLLIKIYNRVISLRIINRNNRLLRRIRAVFFHNICFECKAYFGKKNSDRTFYVIRCPQDRMGLFAVINYVVYHLKIADKNGWEPVVDWQHYPNKYFTEDNMAGKQNVWEYFFEQTSNVSLKDVYASTNVIMSGGDWDAAALKETSDESLLEDSHYIYSKYIKLNNMMEQIVDAESQRIGFDAHNILAVKIRGTDFITARPEDHSEVSGVEKTIEIIDKKTKDWGEFDAIYLATEDQDILETMKKHYGKQLLYTETTTYSCGSIGNRWLGDHMDEADGNKIESMRGYLLSTYMLTKADYLIAPCVGGTVGAMRIKGSYKGICII